MKKSEKSSPIDRKAANDKSCNRRCLNIRRAFKLLPTIWAMEHQEWMSPDEYEYIDDYLKQHPGKKYNWLLKKRLRAQYSLRGFKNDNKQHKSSD